MCVCRPLRVIATVSLLGLAVAAPALGQESDGDMMAADDETVLPPPPPPAVPGLSVISSADDAVPPLRRKRKLPEDPYAPTGLRQGGLTFFPTLEIGSVLTSNVAQSPGGGDGDVGLRLKPGLRLESNWSRHRLTATASGEVVRYLDEDDLSSAGADVQAQLRLDVRHGTWIDFENGYTLTSTGASNTEVPDTATGNRLSHEFRTSAGVTHEAAFADTQFKVGLRRNLFEDVALSGGGSEDNSDRNYTELGISLRGTFNRGAVIRPFAEVAYAPRFHDKSADRNGLKRDSHGVSATLGLRIDDDPLWSGEAGVTYLVRDYEDPTLDTVHAPGLLANLQWRPTELTKVDLSATLGITETASATESGTTSWGASATVTQAVRDNLDLIGGATFSSARSNAGTDETYGAKAGLAWKLNPFVTWSLMYEGTWYDSAAAGSDYDEHQLMGSVILQR